MLEVKNLTKIYTPKHGIPVRAVDGVDLEVGEKGMVFILGRSGSGKSTMLNLLGGLDRYSDGEIIIKGKSSKDFSQSEFDSYRNTYVGFIFQEFNILSDFNVGQNIALAMELQGKKATTESLNDLLETVDLAGYANRKPNELSGGQKQRVAIARALIKDPEIILADEPTGALDSNTGIQILETLKKLSEKKLVVVVSHDRGFAETYGDRIIEMADGKIISDVTKYKADAEVKTEGVSVIDNKIVRITKGYKLTEADFALINNYIEKNESDTYISVDNSANESFRRAAKITVDGSKEGFRSTTADDVNKTKGVGSLFALIRSKLPQRNALKIGASSLKHKPVRLAFTILLSTVAFMMFGVADTLGAYNKYTTATQSIIDTNIEYASFTKTGKPNESSEYASTIPLNDNDIKTLEEEFPEADFLKVYSARQSVSDMNMGNISADGMLDTSKLPSYGMTFYPDSNQIAGYSVITEEYIADFGYTLTGKLAQTEDEVVITKYLFDIYAITGYVNPLDENDKIEKLSKPQELVGKTILVENYPMTVSGVLDTHCDDENRYSALKTLPDENGNEMPLDMTLSDYMSYLEMRTYLRSSPHTLAYISQGLADVIEQKYISGTPMQTHAYYAFFDNTDNSNSGTIYLQNAQKIRNIDSVDGLVFYPLMDGKTADNLGTKDIVLSVYELYEVVECLESNNSSGFKNFNPIDFDNFFSSESVVKYVSGLIEEKDEALTKLLNALELTSPESLSDTTKLTNTLMNGIPLETYNENKELLDRIITLALEDFVKSCGNDFYDYLELALNCDDFNYDTPFTRETGYNVVGIYLSCVENENAYSSFYCILATQETIDSLPLPKVEYGPYTMMVGKMPTDADKVAEMVNYSYKSQEDKDSYVLTNSVTQTLSQVNSIIEIFSSVCLWIGVGFAVFSALMMLNFIATSISYKKREIGILRAVGARSNDVFRIFFSEAAIIALVNWLLSSLACFGIISTVNLFLRNDYGLQLTILNMGIRQILFILLISLFVAAISSFIPVMRIAHKKPIDAIQNR